MVIRFLTVFQNGRDRAEPAMFATYKLLIAIPLQLLPSATALVANLSDDVLCQMKK